MGGHRDPDEVAERRAEKARATLDRITRRWRARQKRARVEGSAPSVVSRADMERAARAATRARRIEPATP